jgi:hypothetical protein
MTEPIPDLAGEQSRAAAAATGGIVQREAELPDGLAVPGVSGAEIDDHVIEDADERGPLEEF